MEKINPSKLIRNKELESIVPHLTEERFIFLKEDICKNPVHVEVPIIVATINGVENTIIDGYNRHKAVVELIAEGKLSSVYEIPISYSPIKQLQSAKEYSIEINLARRQLDTYQTVTWAMGVYGDVCTDEEVSRKIKVARQRIVEIRKLNNMLKCPNCANDEKMTEFKNGLQNGDIGHIEVLKALETSTAIDNMIACVEDEKFKKELTEQFKDSKYSKPTIKAVETEIQKHDNPALFTTKEDTYQKGFNKIMDAVEKLEKVNEDKVAILNVSTNAKFKEASDWLLERKNDTKGYACIVFFELPALKVNQ